VYGNHEQLMEMTGREYAAVIGSALQQQQHQQPKQGTSRRQNAG